MPQNCHLSYIYLKEIDKYSNPKFCFCSTPGKHSFDETVLTLPNYSNPGKC